MAEPLRVPPYITYRLEVPDMAYTIEDFKRDTLRLRITHLHELDPADIQAILEQIPAEERCRSSPPKELSAKDWSGRVPMGDQGHINDCLHRRQGCLYPRFDAARQPARALRLFGEARGDAGRAGAVRVFDAYG